MTRLLSAEDALAQVLARVPPPVESKEPCDLDYATGNVLFADVRADADYPAWPRSRVDGYAIAASSAPGTFVVGVEVPAGKAPGDRVASGHAARIFTGGAVPDGADAVVKQEDVTVSGGRLTVPEGVEAGHNVAPMGSECRRGAVVVSRGALVTPAVSGVLASVGVTKVRVSRRPPVAIVPTGAELVPADQVPPPGRIRNSNAAALMSAMWSYGGWPEAHPIAPDTRPELDDALKTALANDPAIVLLSGGVSVGDYDLVPAALADAGVERVFHGVNVQPGKPLWFGVKGATLVFGLPGNPVSALVNAALFVRPAIRKMAGRADAVVEPLVATLGASVGAGAARRRYVPVRTEANLDGKLIATPLPFAGSGDVFGFSRADLLLVVPENSPPRAAGERCVVIPLSGSAR